VLAIGARPAFKECLFPKSKYLHKHANRFEDTGEYKVCVVIGSNLPFFFFLSQMNTINSVL
jgi:hypothetical protein